MTVPKRFTRLNILSIVSSLLDPSGFAARVIVVARIMQQELCRMNLGWDDCIPESESERWVKWLEGLPSLKEVTLDRCIKPKDFGHVRDMTFC